MNTYRYNRRKKRQSGKDKTKRNNKIKRKMLISLLQVGDVIYFKKANKCNAILGNVVEVGDSEIRIELRSRILLGIITIDKSELILEDNNLVYDR